MSQMEVWRLFTVDLRSAYKNYADVHSEDMGQCQPDREISEGTAFMEGAGRPNITQVRWDSLYQERRRKTPASEWCPGDMS